VSDVQETEQMNVLLIGTVMLTHSVACSVLIGDLICTEIHYAYVTDVISTAENMWRRIT
jgi:hypothetical protein